MNEINKTAFHLLNNVALIKKKYDEIAKISGENFNIFKIFGKEYHENYHSAFISDLLNEKGCHGQGRLFLDLFIPIVNRKIIERNKNCVGAKLTEIVDFDNSTSVTEKIIDEYDRIDVFLSSKKQVIIIENKIGAPFQHRQIKRYFDYARKGKDFVILYLWKYIVTFNEVEFKKEPWPFGLPEENPNMVREKTLSISYREDIKSWIELCIKECANLPIIRETLNQYLNTITRITNQTTNNKMENDIIKQIIESKDNLESALLISGNIDSIKNAVAQRFITSIKNKMEPNNFEIKDKHIEMMYFEIDFKNKFEFYLAIDFNEGFGISSRNSSLINQKTRNFISDKLSFLNKSNVSTESSYQSWIWYTRDWVKFDIEQLYNSETTTRESELLLRIIVALNDIEIS